MNKQAKKETLRILNESIYGACKARNKINEEAHSLLHTVEDMDVTIDTMRDIFNGIAGYEVEEGDE